MPTSLFMLHHHHSICFNPISSFKVSSFSHPPPPSRSSSDLVTSCPAMSFQDSSTVLQQGFDQRVAQFRFYMHPRWAGPNMNQRGTVGINAPNRMGETIVNDWIITEGSDINSRRLARAQGVHMGVGFNSERWYVSVNISFEDDRYVYMPRFLHIPCTCLDNTHTHT
jgi:hypothetical protein